MVRGSGGSHRTTNYDQSAKDKSDPAYRCRKHYQPQTKCSGLGNATARHGTCSKPRRLHEQLPLQVAGEPDQPRGLGRVGDMELRDGATERSVITA